jgi:organic hydroperoxide reductase OsmC/OhrA
MHTYTVALAWTGNLGSGTSGYREYARTHEVSVPGKPVLAGTADPAFRGQPDRWTPEELLIAALAQCHLLWYLHLAAVAGVIVTDYRDEPEGTMQVQADGGGQFTGVVLRPRVTVLDADMVARAEAIHRDANEKCFIARSVNFPVEHEAVTGIVDGERHGG